MMHDFGGAHNLRLLASFLLSCFETRRNLTCYSRVLHQTVFSYDTVLVKCSMNVSLAHAPHLFLFIFIYRALLLVGDIPSTFLFWGFTNVPLAHICTNVARTTQDKLKGSMGPP